MKRLFLTILFLSILIGSVFAYQHAVITLKSGERIECLAKVPQLSSSKLVYKLSKDQKRMKVKRSEVDHVTFLNDKDSTYFSYSGIPYVSMFNSNRKRFDKRRNDLWLPILYRGGEVTLFSYTICDRGCVTYYLLKTKDMDYAVSAGAENMLFAKNFFIKITSMFFGDDPDIMGKINDGTYKCKGDDFYEMVRLYNERKKK
ncbi:MAG: hypothetical protein H6544_01010 [Prevotellaceae bacterium]|nr:hypothetical protein [Prevotellaceae bacterium]